MTTNHRARTVVFAGLLLLGVAGAAVSDEPRPLWATVGALKTPRYDHAAVLLMDGKVLVAGGADAMNLPLQSVELYDPVFRTWSDGMPMSVPRRSFTLTRLTDGRVLAVGGESTGAMPTATAEIYDPNGNTWMAAMSMVSARKEHTASLIPAGVLVAGGADATGNPVTGAEMYDEMGNQWLPAGTLIAARSGHTASVLGDGRVLIAGGHVMSVVISTVLIFDPGTNGWSATAPVIPGRVQVTASVLSNHKVLIAGGLTGVLTLHIAEVYDPVTSQWASVQNLLSARKAHTATVLQSGRVLVAGGLDSSNVPLSSSEIYDPGLGQWSAAGTLAEARVQHTAVLLDSGKVLFAGGKTVNGVVLGSAEEYSTGGLCADVTCPPPGPCQEKGACNPLNGACSYPPKAEGMPCQDPVNQCLENGTCMNGECEGTMKVCPDDLCHQGRTCDPVDGECKGGVEYCTGGEPPPVEFGSLCDTPQRKTGCAASGGVCASEGGVEICCKETCKKCESCALPGHLGECWPEDKTDLRGDCEGSQCSTTCSSQMPEQCVPVEKGTECAPARCIGRSRRLGPGVCVMQGDPCPPGVQEDCGFYACDPLQRKCKTACESVNDCAEGYVCDLAGRCVKPVPVAQGDDPTCFVRGGMGGSGGLKGLWGLFVLALWVMRRRSGS